MKTDGMQIVNEVLEAAREWARENITQRQTGTMVIEIGFLDGGVRTPVVRETRVRRVKNAGKGG